MSLRHCTAGQTRNRKRVFRTGVPVRPAPRGTAGGKLLIKLSSLNCFLLERPDIHSVCRISTASADIYNIYSLSSIAPAAVFTDSVRKEDFSVSSSSPFPDRSVSDVSGVFAVSDASYVSGVSIVPGVSSVSEISTVSDASSVSDVSAFCAELPVMPMRIPLILITIPGIKSGTIPAA